jgi:hypothetical protein
MQWKHCVRNNSLRTRPLRELNLSVSLNLAQTIRYRHLGETLLDSSHVFEVAWLRIMRSSLYLMLLMLCAAAFAQTAQKDALARLQPRADGASFWSVLALLIYNSAADRPVRLVTGCMRPDVLLLQSITKSIQFVFTMIPSAADLQMTLPKR